jgi:hypothetical protein
MPIPPMKEVDIRPGDLTREEFHREYVEHNRPVLLKGGAGEWQYRWTPEMLKERFGDRLIRVEGNETFQNEKVHFKMPLGEALDKMQAGSQEVRVRFASASFLAAVPELQADFEANNFRARYFPDLAQPQSTFWVSPTGNTSVMHHDTFFENLNAMIYGRKHYVFIPPWETPRVYPHFMNESPVNPNEPDLAKYPKFAGVELYQAVSEPGDLLYLPQFWWHFTTALEFTINLNIAAKAPKAAMNKVLSTMPLSSRIVYPFMHNDKLQDWFIGHSRKVHQLYVSLTSRRAAAS